jgi:hypothetical protein
LAEVFKKIKDANDQDAAMLFQSKVLSVYVSMLFLLLGINFGFLTDSNLSSMNGLSKPFQSQPLGWQVV